MFDSPIPCARPSIRCPSVERLVRQAVDLKDPSKVVEPLVRYCARGFASGVGHHVCDAHPDWQPAGV
jgi:hypothetical protein